MVGMPERSEQSGPVHMKPRLKVRSWHTDMVPFAVVIFFWMVCKEEKTERAKGAKTRKSSPYFVVKVLSQRRQGCIHI
jgi:hypothetical protein